MIGLWSSQRPSCDVEVGLPRLVSTTLWRRDCALSDAPPPLLRSVLRKIWLGYLRLLSYLVIFWDYRPLTMFSFFLNDLLAYDMDWMQGEPMLLRIFSYFLCLEYISFELKWRNGKQKYAILHEVRLTNPHEDTYYMSWFDSPCLQSTSFFKDLWALFSYVSYYEINRENQLTYSQLTAACLKYKL